MYRLMLGWVYAICVLGVYAEDFRVFTSQDGRVIEARLVKVDARSKKVTLERENRKKATVPIGALSETDQTYIKDWVAAQDFLSNSKFRVSIDKRKGPVEDKRAETKRPKAPCYYEIKLHNRSASGLSGINAEYCVYKITDHNKGDTKSSVDVISGRKLNISLLAGDDLLWPTEQVKLYRIYSAQTDWSYDEFGSRISSTSYNKVSEDDVEGVWVKLTYKTSLGNIFTRDVCEPESIKEDFSWKSSR